MFIISDELLAEAQHWLAHLTVVYGKLMQLKGGTYKVYDPVKDTFIEVKADSAEIKELEKRLKEYLNALVKTVQALAAEG